MEAVRKKIQQARTAPPVFPSAAQELDEAERGRVANPQALLTL